MNQQEKNRDLVVDVYRQFELGNLDMCRQLTSPSLSCHIGGNVLDRDTWLQFGTMFMTAFPDGRHVWEVAEAVGDYVVLNGYFTGTHEKPFQGIPATGKRIKFSATIIDKVIDGKLVEHRGDFDAAALMQQLGGPEAANRAVVEKMLAAMDAHDWTATRELVSPDCRAQVGAQRMDREGWLGMGRAFYAAFPDASFAMDDWVTSGDRVVALGTWRGTHRQEFQGIPATNRPIAISVIMAFRLADGKIVEHKGEFDTGGLMVQLTSR